MAWYYGPISTCNIVGNFSAARIWCERLVNEIDDLSLEATYGQQTITDFNKQL
jgi:hypothetical protein